MRICATCLLGQTARILPGDWFMVVLPSECEPCTTNDFRNCLDCETRHEEQCGEANEQD